MDLQNVATFLSAVEEGTISGAAASLFISQAAASSRLKALEEDLGVTLVQRQRGGRSIRLTPEGESFLPVAEQMRNLWDEARHLHGVGRVRELRVTASDTFNTTLLVPVYQRFTSDVRGAFLTVQTEHASETHHAVEHQLSDIGFVFVQHPRFRNVSATPLFTEDMVVVAHAASAFGQSGSAEDLRAETEVYHRWSAAFEAWHEQRFPFRGRHRITVGTTTMTHHFLRDAEAWTIASRSLATRLQRRDPRLRLYELDDAPPRRTAYLLEHREPRPWMREVRDAFIAQVREHLANEEVGLI